MPTDISQNNKRIAKNAVMLYIRMFITMLISLYTSRLILQVLGVTDYGIYNVVAGVISIMGLLNSAMSWSTMRFLTFDLGKGDKVAIQNTFNMCIIIFILLSVIFVFFSETIGLWFLNSQMTIPDTRMIAANWVYQFSIAIGVLSLILTPYRSLVFAHEDFNFFACVSITESLLKFAVCFVIMAITFDKLSFYAFLMFAITALLFAAQFIWCKKKYEESAFLCYWDKTLFKNILSYSGWSLFGSLSNMSKDTGLNIVLNLFFTPAVNAACGIANQVNAVVYQFFSSCFSAVNPQIIKYYAKNEINNMMELVFKCSRFSFYLILFLAVPITIEAPTIVSLWLGQLPDHVVPFIRLIVVITAIDATTYPLNACSTATGNIKLYQVMVGVLSLLNIPLSYLALSYGCPPETVFVISLSLSFFTFFAKLWAINKIIDFPVRDYLFKVCVKLLFVTICSISVPLLLRFLFETNIWSSIFNCFVSVVSTALIIFLFGMTKSEKSSVILSLRSKYMSHVQKE